MRSAGLVCLLFATLTIWANAAPAGYYCANDSRIEAVDLSEPVDQGFLDTMRGIGIKTIIRYYDHEDETLPGKTLRRDERNLIVENGFKTAVVFQHHNNQFASFTAERGRQDAERSLALARENSQPRGAGRSTLLPLRIYGTNGRLRTLRPISCSASSRQRILPRRRGR